MAELPIKMTQDSQHRVTGFEVEKCIGDLDISMGSLTFVQMLCALLFLLCIGRSSSSSEFSVIGYDTTDLTSDETLFLLYERWLAEHGKVYKENDLDQKHTRFQIFKHNLLYINSHNKRNESYSLGLNEFSDLTNDEFMSMYVGSLFPTSSIETDHHNSYPHQSIDDANLPESVDWREKGAVTSVKNQGSCGSCWIFSAIAAVEGINQIKTGNLISLSEQEVLDCNFANQGCKGGSKSTVFQYIIKNGGIDTEAAYPYKAKKGICNQNVEKVVTIDGYTSLPSDEYNLQKGVVKQPIGVSIAVGNDFQHYKSGLFTGTCGAKINHGVTVVGYTSGNEACWIVKNSWGTSWGENGFFRFPKNTGDQYGKCYIARSPTHPIKNGSNPSNLDHFPI